MDFGKGNAAHAVDQSQRLILIGLADVRGVKTERDSRGVVPDPVGPTRPAGRVQQALGLGSIEGEGGQAALLQQGVGRVVGEQCGVAHRRQPRNDAIDQRLAVQQVQHGLPDAHVARPRRGGIPILKLDLAQTGRHGSDRAQTCRFPLLFQDGGLGGLHVIGHHVDVSGQEAGDQRAGVLGPFDDEAVDLGAAQDVVVEVGRLDLTSQHAAGHPVWAQADPFGGPHGAVADTGRPGLPELLVEQMAWQRGELWRPGDAGPVVDSRIAQGQGLGIGRQRLGDEADRAGNAPRPGRILEDAVRERQILSGEGGAIMPRETRLEFPGQLHGAVR